MEPINIESDQVLFCGKSVLFFTKDSEVISYLSLDDVLVERTDCGYKFTLERKSPGIAGIMIPATFGTMIEQRNIDPNKTTRFHYSGNGTFFRKHYGFSKFEMDEITTPLVHVPKEDEICSWSCPNECVISNFQYLFEPYVNIEAICDSECSFFLDISSSYIVNLQRYPIPRREILINKCTDTLHLKEALLYGYFPRSVPDKPDRIIEISRSLQATLKGHEVESVLTGSLARRLNGVAIDVHDIDLMVTTSSDVKLATSALESYCDRICSEDGRSKLLFDDVEIDICFDNYNLLPGTNFVSGRFDLKFFSLEGLMWLYFMDLFAISRNEYTGSFKNHVIRALYSISKCMGQIGIIPDVENLEDYSEGCFQILQEMQDFTQEYRDIRINTPFETRIYRKGNQSILPVINHGSPNDARIIVDFNPEHSEWTDISGNTQEVKQEPHENFTVLYLTKVYLPGIVKCQVKAEN